jgi:hypothetical protein
MDILATWSAPGKANSWYFVNTWRFCEDLIRLYLEISKDFFSTKERYIQKICQSLFTHAMRQL